MARQKGKTAADEKGADTGDHTITSFRGDGQEGMERFGKNRITRMGAVGKGKSPDMIQQVPDMQPLMPQYYVGWDED